MVVDEPSSPFQHSAAFAPAEVRETLGLGPLEQQYRELFAHVLEDGVITAEERAELERAACNLGLDPARLLRLEQAMKAAYETHHQVRIVEQYEQPAPSLALADLTADESLTRSALLARLSHLEQRVRELEGELRRAQSALPVEVDLGALESGAAASVEDPETAWRRVRRDPLSAAAYRDLYRIHAARGDQDRAWCTAQALVALDRADDEQRDRFERHRARGLRPPKAGISPQAWLDQLTHPEQDYLTGQIFGAIVAAVLVGRVSTLQRDRSLYRPDPTHRQDPTKSTVTAVRALPWAASILGLLLPAIYVDKDFEGSYVHVPGVPPMTVIGKQVLRGRSELEYAFLAGRHLASYRQELYVRVLFCAVPDLEDLFLSALTLGSPSLPIAEDRKRRVAPIAQAIEPLLDSQQTDMLRSYFVRFVEEGGRTNLGRWSQAADKTACRAGLLLSGDLGTALAILEKEEGPWGEQAQDLVAFCVSDRYSTLRSELGLAIEA
jgi:hypothetical protein